MFSVILGAHQDYRHRKSGDLPEEVDNLTSHVPFVALLTGRQSWTDLSKEIKTENMAGGASIALLLAMRRFRLARKLVQK